MAIMIGSKPLSANSAGLRHPYNPHVQYATIRTLVDLPHQCHFRQRVASSHSLIEGPESSIEHSSVNEWTQITCHCCLMVSSLL